MKSLVLLVAAILSIAMTTAPDTGDTATGTVTQDTSPLVILAQAPRPLTVQYLGCFAENTNSAPGGLAGRVLNGDMFSSAAMTHDACIARCRAGNFAFAGVQFGSFCFCGNDFNRNRISLNCKMPCAGNPRELCGGEWANGIFSLK